MNRRYRRSPFLLVEWRGSEAVVLACNTMRRVTATPEILQLLARFDGWHAVGEIGADDAALDGRIERLVSCGLLEESAASSPPDPRDGWTPYELAVHRMTNSGGTRPASGRGHPPARRQPVPGDTRTALPAPDALAPHLFADVLEQRRTRRRYAARPLRLAELSTVLHHAARVVREGHDETVGDYALRPFAGAGGRCELEIYVVANDVDGISRGVHHFDARAHELRWIRDRDSHQERLIRWVHGATGGLLSRDPPVILLLTAVFARVMAKYQNLGLSLIYKDTGCLFQTLYLVATAMGLAPCAIGGGEELANSRWLGLDPLEESQVGCFLLGPVHELS